jgi:hypothetical protein
MHPTSLAGSLVHVVESTVPRSLTTASDLAWSRETRTRRERRRDNHHASWLGEHTHPTRIRPEV